MKVNGHNILVEKNAGAGSGFEDEAYAQAGAEIVADPKEIFKRSDMVMLYTPFSITAVYFMGLKSYLENESKPLHLLRHHGIGPCPMGHDGARVVDDTPGAGPVHELNFHHTALY
jgi:hypothetical protein